MFVFKVVSQRELSETELKQIKDILINSQCPNESFSNSIEGFMSTTLFEGGSIAGNVVINSSKPDSRLYSYDVEVVRCPWIENK